LYRKARRRDEKLLEIKKETLQLLMENNCLYKKEIPDTAVMRNIKILGVEIQHH
jgi:hypothetical protein